MDYEPGAHIKHVIDSISHNATELAITRCGNKACSFIDVVIEPGPLTKRFLDSDMFWFEDIKHGVACEQDDTCPYAQTPEKTTKLFGDAINITLQEEGVIGLLKTDTNSGIDRYN